MTDLELFLIEPHAKQGIINTSALPERLQRLILDNSCYWMAAVDMNDLPRVRQFLSAAKAGSLEELHQFQDLATDFVLAYFVQPANPGPGRLIIVTSLRNLILYGKFIEEISIEGPVHVTVRKKTSVNIDTMVAYCKKQALLQAVRDFFTLKWIW